MKHGVSGFKLKRDGGSRKALLKGLVTSVIEHERVITTVPKAKAVQPLVEKMITLAKRDTRHTLRPAQRRLHARGSPRLPQGRRRGAGHAGAGRVRTGQARGGTRQAPRR